MKKVLMIIIFIITLLWIGLRIFGRHNSNNILSNQASFDVFVDVSSFDIDNYFQLPNGTCEKEEYNLICKLPVKAQGFKPNFVKVRTDLENIDCNAGFEKGKHVKYEVYELKETNIELMLVYKNANLNALNSPLGEKIIVESRSLPFNYSKGKINRILVTQYGVHDYCE